MARRNKTSELASNAQRRCHQGMVGVPVEVWWGLEWVKTTGDLIDENTIIARLETRAHGIQKCRIKNSKGVKAWRHSNID